MRRLVFWVIGLVTINACSSTAPTRGTSQGQGGQRATSTSSTSTGGSSEAVGGAAGAAGQSAPSFGPLGLRCDTNEPCGSGLTCFGPQSTELGGVGPAGGFCSKYCSADSDCLSIDAKAHCAELFVGEGESPRICVPDCTLGDDHACGARDDLACWPLGDTTTPVHRGCLPTCNNDDQCPSGTVCDGWLNLCSDLAPAGGLPLGSECDPNDVTNDCAEGFCIELASGGACTSYCRRGTFPQCGGNGESLTCGWVFTGDEAAGAADIGMCAGTCACDSDCPLGSYCELHSDRESFDKPGICTAGSQVGVESCP